MDAIATQPEKHAPPNSSTGPADKVFGWRQVGPKTGKAYGLDINDIRWIMRKQRKIAVTDDAPPRSARLEGTIFCE
jgi:hypothetical protein